MHLPTFRFSGNNFEVIHVRADVIVAIHFLTRTHPNISIVSGRNESERTEEISEMCTKSTTQQSKTIERFLENKQAPFAFAKLWAGIGINLLHAIGGDEGVPDIAAQNWQIITMSDKIKESDAYALHDR
jgi:hypothetical protein